MTDIGELVLRLRADSAQLQAELSRATGTVKQSSSQMVGALEDVKHQFLELVPAITAAAFVEMSLHALEAADNLYIMGQRIGFASSTLSALNIPLKQNGSSVDEFSSSMKFMSRNIELASEGNAHLLSRFDALGLSVTKLKSLTPEEQFYAIAKALGESKSQGELTANAMLILGRGAAGLIPIIKETGGNIKEMTDKAKAAGDALTDEQIKRVHEFEDAWISAMEHAKIYIVDFLTYFHKLGEDTRKWIDELRGIKYLPANASYDRPKEVGQATFLKPGDTSLSDQARARISASLKANGLPGFESNSAAGTNADIAKKAAASSATKATKDATDTLDAYIKKLQGEADALSLSKLKLEEYKAEQEGATKALADYNNGLRASPKLTQDEIANIDAAVDALDRQKQKTAELAKEEQKHTQMIAQMQAQVSASLADMAINYKNLGSTVTGVLSQIAKQIIEMQITTPLTQSIAGLFSSSVSSASSSFIGPMPQSSSFFSSIEHMLGFAGGGNPPVGVPSIVGENGPEIFVPSQAGTVIPNSSLGGSSVNVYQTFNMQPGLPETVGAAIRNAAPVIAAQAHASVFAALQKGGPESRIAGLRS